jgi:signal transduction histidine kinase/ActR/RegA family two-component response regulator
VTTLVFVIATLAGVTAHAALYHLILHVRGRGEHQARDRYFALTAFALVLYDVLCIGLYTSGSVDESREWQRLQLATIVTAGLGLVYFVSEFAAGSALRRMRRVAWSFPILAAVGLFERRGLLLTDASKVVRFELPVIGEIVYVEAASGPLQILFGAAALFGLAYVFAVALELRRLGQRRRSRALMLGAGMFAIAAVNDNLMSMGIIESLYLMEFAWTAVVVMVGYSMFEAVVANTRAKEELAEARLQLVHADRLESAGQLAGSIAHDLNNMLTPVLGYAQVLRRRLPSDSQEREQLEQLAAAAQRAAALTRKLLALGQKQVLEVAPIDVGAGVLELEPLLKHLLPPGVQLRVVVEDDLPLVEADGSQIEQVWMNLVANARDAMPDGGRVSIEVRRSRRDGRPGVDVAVSDTGGGMTPDLIANVFEPFFTTKARGEGTGLGLSIVRGIVEQHGGEVDVESTLGEGTTFIVSLPATTRVPARTSPARERVSGELAHARVLVVDDDEGVLTFVADVLRDEGYQVVTASSASALEAVLSSLGAPPDLLVTDVVLPDTDGTRVAARVSARFPGVRCVYMTGHADDVLAPHGLLRESVELLHKPFTPEQLIRKATKALTVDVPERAIR